MRYTTMGRCSTIAGPALDRIQRCQDAARARTTDTWAQQRRGTENAKTENREASASVAGPTLWAVGAHRGAQETGRVTVYAGEVDRSPQEPGAREPGTTDGAFPPQRGGSAPLRTDNI